MHLGVKCKYSVNTVLLYSLPSRVCGILACFQKAHLTIMITILQICDNYHYYIFPDFNYTLHYITQRSIPWIKMAFVNGDKYDDSVTGISENEPLLMKDDKPSDTASSPPGGGGSVDLSCFSSQARRCGAALTRPETLTYMLVAICGMELRVGVTAIAVEMPAMVQVSERA